MKINKQNHNINKKAYIIGGGIASLASAAYLIRDGHIPGKDITIIEESDKLGGSLDGKGSPETGYFTRGYRMFEDKAYLCAYDLLSFIPSLADSSISIKEEFFNFNKIHPVYSKLRLIGSSKKSGLSWKDKFNLIKIMARSESSLGTSRIQDNFSPLFFKSDNWLEFCTTFAFQPWHSAAEMRRYFLRFMQDSPFLGTLSCIRNAPYNQYESIILPISNWLTKQGVRFEMNSRAANLDFKQSDTQIAVECIRYIYDGKERKIAIDKNDLVFANLGSMTAASAMGSSIAAPRLEPAKLSSAWVFWENIAKKYLKFGSPSVFNSHQNESTMESFTATFRDPAFFKLVEKMTGNQAGSGGYITLKDSNWLLSVVLPQQPHFINQPDNAYVCWGYGLFSNEKGNFTPKKMSECTGEEILAELCRHLGFKKEIPSILKTSNCIPCLMPYITSQFLPRKKEDRPPVAPEGLSNMAFIGQFCEIPNETSFTVEYSVRSAQLAVISLLKLNKKETPIYKGQYNLKVLYSTLKTILFA